MAAIAACWSALLKEAGVQRFHAVELFKSTKQFKRWKPQDVNKFAVLLDQVIAKHLKLGFAVVIRDDDYKAPYKESSNPRRSRKDSKYSLCFRACLNFVPSFIADELAAAGQTNLSQETTMNFVLEDGHKNVGDARRLFNLYKDCASAEWNQFVGTFDVVKKESPGAQAADFLSYCVYRNEICEHGRQPSIIEQSSYTADAALVANTDLFRPTRQTAPMLFRIPVGREQLKTLNQNGTARQSKGNAGSAR
ncbi:MAG: DUF3800 domain-containing protein [Rhodomicrobium sp.]